MAGKDVSEAEGEKFARAFLALKEGKDDRVLQILRAQKFVVADDVEYGSTRKIAHEMKMFEPSTHRSGGIFL